MGAKFSPLYDIRQAKSITISGQSSLLILMHDIRNVPSVRTVELNTDAIQFEIDEDKLPLAESILNNWQKRYRLELEREDILKLVMRDVNNYASIIKTPYGEEVNCKGSCFAGVPKIKIHDDGKLETIYKHDFKQNSMVVVREALLKKLLFNIPIEKTINNCSEIECFQIITHLGGSYEKCVQESEQGDILLQRNNRIYAGKKTSGKIIKVKYDGRRDSLANCPPNPIVDNANKCSIEDVNKEWYIDLAKQWADDFLGIKRLDEYKKDELLDMAINMGLEVDKKTKKAVLVELIKQQKKERKTMAKKETEKKITTNKTNIYEKINAMKEDIKNMEFVLDCSQATNLGGKDYPSIGQYYRVVNDLSRRYNLLFQWDILEYTIEKEMFKPQGKMPQHVATVKCRALFTDTDKQDNTESDSIYLANIVDYQAIASGSDSCDKAISAASSMAFRNWFDKNFAPSYLTVDEFNGDSEIVETEKSAEPKVPTYIPAEKKAELVKEVVAEKQTENTNSDDVKRIIDNIMKVRELLNDQEWGAKTLGLLIQDDIDSVALMQIDLKVANKLDSLGGE